MTEWFNRTPGSIAAQGTDDPTLVLVGDGPPDWVRTPPELGPERRLRVQRVFVAPCPSCRGADVRHLALDGGMYVAECNVHGFTWYRLRSENTEGESTPER